MSSELTPRQIAFVKLSKLYNDLILKTPVEMTAEEQNRVAQLMSREFNKVFDEYDQGVRARKRFS